VGENNIQRLTDINYFYIKKLTNEEAFEPFFLKRVLKKNGHFG